MKKITFILSLFILFHFLASPLLAQNLPNPQTPTSGNTGTSQTRSSKVCVKVGEPTEPMPTVCTQSNTKPAGGGTSQPGDSEGLARILEWDEIIVSGLETGVSGYFNRMMTNHTNDEYSTGTWPGTTEGNLYWCTFSIIDAYRLAGVPGLDRSKGHGAVVTMRKYWKTAEAQELGYKYVDYESDNSLLANVQPGYAMFMEAVPGEFNQTEHVNMIKSISINSSGDGQIITNDSNTSRKSKEFQVKDWRVLGTIYPVRGFGGI